MELSEAVALKLISEIKKPGRECLYDLSNSSYKNNHIKQNVWSEVARTVGISSKLIYFYKILSLLFTSSGWTPEKFCNIY